MKTKTVCIIILVVASVVLTASLYEVSAQPNTPDPHVGATQPTREQNVDSNGWIAVHEQGTANVNVTGGQMDVNITNDSLEVTGTVSVDNFPDTQDVHVTSVSDSVKRPAPVTHHVYHHVLIPPDNQIYDYDMGNIQATMVYVESGGDLPEIIIKFYGMGSSNPVYGIDRPDGLSSAGYTVTFPYPINFTSATARCVNESSDCDVTLSVVGY